MSSYASSHSGRCRGGSATTGGGGIGGAGGAMAIMDHALPPLACPFVSRGGYRDYDDDVLDDVDSGVYRSTSVAPTAFAPSSLSDRSMEFVAGYSVSSRDDMSPSQLVRDVQFSSLAEAFPLPERGKYLLQPSAKRNQDVTLVFQSRTASTTMGTEPSQRPRFMSTANRATPPLTSIAEMTQLDEQTILNRSVTIKKESGGDEDRLSPFGACSAHEGQPYVYNATKTELDDMEQIKWNLQEQVFQRYFDLKQKEVHWGSLEVRTDNRIFFLPGKRRQAILEEKKFHDTRYKKAVAQGDSSLYEDRQAHMAQLLRNFLREETKHKQELMLAHLEKNSQFSKFPVLCNRFLLTRLLGKGGNGEVWDVVDFADQKTRWALKLSVSHKHARREHFTHSRLRHPNIARVGEAAYTIEYRQQMYTGFTVESVDSDLQQLIEMHECFDEITSLNVLYQLLSALTYLHNEMKIAHYDLKPTNILVGHDQCVKLTDFDLARSVHEPITSSVVGTLRYLPPECFRPNFGDCQGTAEKADIWMIGVVYCVMLWEKHPIIADKASHEEARCILSRYNGSVDYQRPVSDLSRWVIQGCMHPDPRCRPTAFQLLQALENAAQAHRSG